MTLRVLILAYALLLSASPSSAQESDWETRLEQGARAFEAERSEKALRLLAQFEGDALGYVSADLGPAALWRGDALLHTGATDEALKVYLEGMQRLRARDTPDVQLALAYLAAAFQLGRDEHYATAARGYLTVLHALPAGVALKDVFPLHLAEATQVVLPPKVLIPSDADAPPLGRRIAAWWYGQDLSPTTAANERLYEHLERWAHAHNRYTTNGRLDDRGRLHVRFGPPDQAADLRYNDLSYIRRHIARSDFRDAEFWVYRRVGDAAHFLLRKDTNGRYVIGRPAELLAPGLRTGRSAGTYLRALEEIYHRLSLQHGDYALRYHELTDWVAFDDLSAQSRSDFGPRAFALRTRTEMETEDARIERRREQVVPASRSDLLDALEPLTLAVRHARFLNLDGTTRTEVYWRPSAEVWQAPASEILSDYGVPQEALLENVVVEMAAATVQQTPPHRERAVLTVSLPEPSDVGALPAFTLLAPPAGQPYDLVVEWRQRFATPATSAQPGTPLGPPLRKASLVLREQVPLGDPAADLVLSDLRPFRLGPGDDLDRLEMLLPYPDATWPDDDHLGLYLEVYGLATGEDGRSRYELTYTVEHRSDATGLRQLFRRGEERDVTSVSGLFVGASGTAKEHLVLDLRETPHQGRLVVTVEVCDLVGGGKATRTIAFDRPPSF